MGNYLQIFSSEETEKSMFDRPAYHLPFGTSAFLNRIKIACKGMVLKSDFKYYGEIIKEKFLEITKVSKL
jgi:hypothetical protein